MEVSLPGSSPLAVAVSDGELLRRVLVRDAAALDALYARYSGYVMGIALRSLGTREEAEEVVQDVFWQLWRVELRYDPMRGRFPTWLFAVARNRCLDRLRRRARAPLRVAESELAALASQPEQEAESERGERQREVRAALEALPVEQRAALELAFFAGLSHSEIAARTGAALGTVKSRIKRGLERLRGGLVAAGALQ